VAGRKDEDEERFELRNHPHSSVYV
jgi:hypothetical protein